MLAALNILRLDAPAPYLKWQSDIAIFLIFSLFSLDLLKKTISFKNV